MIYPSDDDAMRTRAEAGLGIPVEVDEAIHAAHSATLRYSLERLSWEIAEYRRLIASADDDREWVDKQVRQIQLRVERCRLIAAELRRRGDEVGWYE